MAIWLKFKGYIIALAGAILGVLSIYFVGRSHGHTKAQTDAREADNANARKVEDAADRVRRNDGGGASPVERLRKYKRLRDVSDDL